MTVAEALAAALALGLDRLDAQLLLLHALGRAARDRAWLLAHDRDPVEPPAADRYLRLCGRRAAGEPLAYIVGQREFYGLALKIDARALDPRPDTETLVDWALELLEGRARPRLADLGCGSGAIALALKKTRPDARVVATDLSAEALALARENAAALGLEIEFAQADWLEGTRFARQPHGGGFDLIVSNPPYIAEDDPHLAALSHEPRGALVAARGGLAELHRIIAQARARLRRGGWLLLEHGHQQAQPVRELLEAAGFENIGSRRDLAGIERCSGGRAR